MNNPNSPFVNLEDKLNRIFVDKDVLLRALCTSEEAAKRAGVTKNPEDNSRMAFIGEQVLRFLVMVHHFAQGADLGDIMAGAWRWTGRERLAHAGRRLELGRYLLHEPGSVVDAEAYADGVAAIIAAAYCDGGMDAVADVVEAMQLWRKELGSGDVMQDRVDQLLSDLDGDHLLRGKVRQGGE